MTDKEKSLLLEAVHKIVFDQWETMSTQWASMDKRLRKLEENNSLLYHLISKKGGK